jgi:amino acid adenylation domain-containing protein
MTAKNTFSCYVIGETTLTLQCCEKLLERGHAICGIISPSPDIAAWAKSRSIPCDEPPLGFNGLLHSRPCDYLFSIVNNAVLPAELLALPRRMAINFHDAPLPRYGGIHATSWAIMNREQTHGITWHVMAPKIDAGGVLKQKMLSVSSTDTALSLNMRCYQKAAEAFGELVDELAAGTAAEMPQNLSQRTYYSRYRRPERGCLICWNRTAEEVDAFVRSLDFGPYPNAIGVPKVCAGGEFFIVKKLRVLDTRSPAAPGTVLAADAGGITVATADRDVCLFGLATLEGCDCDAAQRARDCGIRPGYRFIEPEAEIAGRLTELYRFTCCHESFWREQLRDLQPLALPDMRLYGRSSEPAGDMLFSLQLQPELLRAALLLVPAAKPWQITAAFYIAFLARHAGATEIHVGFGRDKLTESIKGLEGFFAGCVPLRLSVDACKPLEECCRAAVEKLSDIERSGTFPRDLIARHPDLKSQAGQSMPVRIRHLRDFSNLLPAGDAALEFLVADDGDCMLRINTAVVDAAYGESLKNQLMVFLHAAAGGMHRPLDRLPLASEADKRRIIEAWNSTAAPFAEDVCMHELFERQVLVRPDSTATVYEGASVSYEELNRRANALAWYLRQQGAGRGSLVGICLDRSHDMIAALLAILKAGGAYVPLEPSYPAERIEAIVHSAGIKVIVSQEKHARLTLHAGVKTVSIDGAARSAIDAQKTGNPPRVNRPDDLAYVIYTSGSTGAPKGVMVAHTPFANLFEWCCRTCGFGPDDSVLFITSLGFDLSVFDIFGILGCGGRIYIASDASRRDASQLARALCTQEITFWDSAPAALQLLAPALKAQPRPVANTKLRQIFLSGDWIPVTLPDDIREVFPAAQVMSLGGATEATVWSNYFPVNRVEPQWRSIPYGRPIQNSRYYILDKYLQVCPPGVAGNLYIAGQCLSMGYVNEPELTGRSFVPDPFQEGPDKLMYRTGDLARFYPDGTMEFLGRSDFQVKVRGYRIELGEIEHVLQRHVAVKEAVVAVQTGAAGDQKLVAYLTAAGSPLPPSKELRAYAAQFLPDYMVPNMFVRLGSLPVTSNGKLDRKQLPWPVGEAAAQEPAPQEAQQAAQLDMELVLGAYFREVLGVAAIAPAADFFDLGVTSLNLIQIVERLHEEHGLDVTVETFLDHPSIAALAAGIGAQLPASTGMPPAGQLPEQALCCPQQAMPAAASCAAPASGAAVQDMLRKIQIVLPVEAFTESAMLEEVTARVRQMFAESRITAGAGTPPPPAPPHAPSAAVLQAKAAAESGSPEQNFLAAAFTSVLRIASIAQDADFFDLGVTSLNLIEIAELLHEQHGIDVSVEVFLDHTTLRSLAQYLQGMLPAAGPRTGDTVLTAPEHVSARPDTAPPDAAEIVLEPVSFAPQEYARRACCRSFATEPVPLRNLSRLLALLKCETVSGEPKYLYPSAGGLNAVQTYVYVKAGRVESVPAGIYYYHPAAHQLMAVGEGAVPQEIMHPSSKPVFEQAGFCIFFIAQLAALRPVYDCLSPALALLDAGYMTELLMSRQEAAGLGVCPLAGTDFGSMRHLFSLEETHLFMACLACGLPGSRADCTGSPVNMFQAGLTDHFAGPAPDWACLRAVAAGALDCLNVLTPQQHENLHRSQPHVRKCTHPQGLPLQPVSFLHNQYLLRSTQRSFARRPAAFGDFSKFMALLRLVQQSGGYAALYDSAAGAYTVQLYVQVRAGAVEQVPEGIYLYDQAGHKLRLISSASAAGLRQAHFPRNRSYFAEAGFSIFCIADMQKLEPLFGSQALQLAMLEAGCIGQVLMDHQAEFGMGVCPIGAMRFEGMRSLFGLGQHQVLLHSFLCGQVNRPAALLAGLVPLTISR